MLPVSIRSYLKYVLKYKLLIMDNYHPDTLYLHQQGCVDPRLFFEAKRNPSLKNLGDADLEDHISSTSSCSFQSKFSRECGLFLPVSSRFIKAVH
jgi:hypothetical protein